MSGTSESEIRAMLRDLGVGEVFVGTFDNSFSGFKRSKVPMCAIVNTGSRQSGGVHWIAAGIEPAARRIYVFDPLGWNDSQLQRLYRFSIYPMLHKTIDNYETREKYFKNCFIVTRNTQAVQCSCAGSCGLFCVLFVYCFSKNPHMATEDRLLQSLDGKKAAVRPSHWQALHANQELLYSFLSNRCKYFRDRARDMEQNTRTGLIKTHEFI